MIPRDGSFDAALCMGNSFGYLDLAGTRTFVALAGAIRPGGGLVIDFNTTAESVLPSAQLGHLLTDAGFLDIDRYGGPDGTPYTLGAGRLLLTARRAERRPQPS